MPEGLVERVVAQPQAIAFIEQKLDTVRIFIHVMPNYHYQG